MVDQQDPRERRRSSNLGYQRAAGVVIRPRCQVQIHLPDIGHRPAAGDTHP
jgi:hypothetical protein